MRPLSDRRALPAPGTTLTAVVSSSLDGEVKLWDVRGGDAPVQTWEMFRGGLSAFDVHEQTEVFAAYVVPLSLPLPLFLVLHHRR